MSLMLANIKRGDEVILPSLNFIASAQAILLCGAKPIFCDVEKDASMVFPVLKLF